MEEPMSTTAQANHPDAGAVQWHLRPLGRKWG
jgi:hypothetical protein